MKILIEVEVDGTENDATKLIDAKLLCRFNEAKLPMVNTTSFPYWKIVAIVVK